MHDSDLTDVDQRVSVRYVQGIIHPDWVYLVTDLIDGTSIALEQPQKIWTLGRGKGRVALLLRDKQLSRVHAAIQYVEQQGFYLVDLGSTNGSTVNGEQIREGRTLLKDKDYIQIGKTSFTFYMCDRVSQLGPIAPEVYDKIRELEPTLILLPERSSASDNMIPDEDTFVEDDLDDDEGEPFSN